VAVPPHLKMHIMIAVLLYLDNLYYGLATNLLSLLRASLAEVASKTIFDLPSSSLDSKQSENLAEG
jgi:hypothetical protein